MLEPKLLEILPIKRVAWNRKQRENRGCACGCGKIFECKTDSKKKYVLGHHTFTEEFKKQSSQRRIGKESSEETRRKQSENSVGRHLTQEQIEKRQRSRKEKANKRGFFFSEETLHKMSLSAKKDTGRSERTKQYWKDPKNAEKFINSLYASPNKFETKCMAYLNMLYPNRFKFVGDGSCIINGKSADAVDYRTRTIYLFHGVYWHLIKDGFEINDKNKRTVEAIDSIPFVDAGFTVKFIWEDEFTNMYKTRRT